MRRFKMGLAFTLVIASVASLMIVAAQGAGAVRRRIDSNVILHRAENGDSVAGKITGPPPCAKRRIVEIRSPGQGTVDTVNTGNDRKWGPVDLPSDDYFAKIRRARRGGYGGKVCLGDRSETKFLPQ